MERTVCFLFRKRNYSEMFNSSTLSLCTQSQWFVCVENIGSEHMPPECVNLNDEYITVEFNIAVIISHLN